MNAPKQPGDAARGARSGTRITEHPTFIVFALLLGLLVLLGVRDSATIALFGVLLFIWHWCVKLFMPSNSPRKITDRFRNTVAGILWLLFAAFLLAIGWAKGINLLLLFAYPLLLVWVLNFALAGRRLHLLKAKRKIDGPVFAQTPFAEDVDFANPGAKPQIGVRLIDQGPDHLQSWFLTKLGNGESVQFAKQLTLPRRGRYVLEPLRAWSAYPFGLVQRTAIIGAEDDELIVLPRLGQVHRGKLRRFLTHTAPLDGVFSNQQRAQPLTLNEFHSLRPFRRGDSPRWIHWRTSARRGELMVREFEKATTESLLLVLDPCLYPGSSSRTPAGQSIKDSLLEDIISFAATVCWEYCREHGDRLTLAIAGAQPILLDGITGREHAQDLLETLATQRGHLDPAWVQPGAPDPAWQRLMDRLTASRLPPGPILFASTTKTGLGDELRRHLHGPVAVVNATELDACDFYERPTRAS